MLLNFFIETNLKRSRSLDIFSHYRLLYPVISYRKFSLFFLRVFLIEMQSVNQPVPNKKMGHSRKQSYGKIMPISSLLNNLIATSGNMESSNTESAMNDRSTLTQSIEAFTLNSRVNERSDGDSRGNVSDLTLNFINHEKLNEANEEQEQHQPIAKVDMNQTFLKCVNYHHHESEIDDSIITNDPKSDTEDNIDRLLSKKDNAPCLICTKNDGEPLKHSLMNVLCKKLCDESCNTSTKTCQSNDDIGSNISVTAEIESDTKTGEGLAKLETENILQKSNSSRQVFLASMLEPITDTIDNDDESHVVPLTMENLKQFNDDYFREKLAIAEALANTSMMTSTAAKNRLVARKIEMSLNAPDFVYDPENSEYIPPKELLMYLVR